MSDRLSPLIVEGGRKRGEYMPTERFYHLPEVKKAVIREAAIEEFSRVPFEKASINKIIQNAGISRGSFYTYFEDKRDVLRYIFSDTADRLKDSWTESIRKNDGDIWIASDELLEKGMRYVEEQMGAMLQMAQNIMFVQDFDQLTCGSNGSWNGEQKGDEILTALYEITDKSLFKDADFSAFKVVVTLIMSCIGEGVSRYYRHMEDEENIKKVFREKLEILQYGICKQ